MITGFRSTTLDHSSTLPCHRTLLQRPTVAPTTGSRSKAPNVDRHEVVADLAFLPMLPRWYRVRGLCPSWARPLEGVIGSKDLPGRRAAEPRGPPRRPSELVVLGLAASTERGRDEPCLVPVFAASLGTFLPRSWQGVGLRRTPGERSCPPDSRPGVVRHRHGACSWLGRDPHRGAYLRRIGEGG